MNKWCYLFVAILIGVSVATGYAAAEVAEHQSVNKENQEFECAARRTLPTVGVYYYAWYNESPWDWESGYLRRVLDNPQPPALGEYVSSNQNVISQHAVWSHDYGIDLWVCSWGGVNSLTDIAINNSLRYNGDFDDYVKYCLFYESVWILPVNQDNMIDFDDADTRTQFLADMSYVAMTYFDPLDNNYFKIDGKPVIYFYLSRLFTGDFTSAIQQARNQMRAISGYDVYLVGDEGLWPNPNPAHFQPFDAVTDYNCYNPNYEGYPYDNGYFSALNSRYSVWRSAAQSAGKGYIPIVVPGYNDRAVRPDADHTAFPRQADDTLHDGTTFEVILDMAKDYLTATPNIIQITSFNEWWEDSIIEPTINGWISENRAPFDYTQGFRYYGFGEHYLQILLERTKGTSPISYLATGWENGQRMGYTDTVILGDHVSGYLAGIPPECERRGAELGMQPYNGDWCLMVAGEDTSNTENSYAFYVLFEDDININQNTKLKYYIYKYQSQHFCIDFVCKDGTTLRNSGIKDQHGYYMHPSSQYSFMRNWWYIEADLSPLAGKTIDIVMIGYDDSPNSEVGQFRAYIDKLQIGGLGGGG